MDDNLHRNRFILLNVLRLGGLAIALTGIAISVKRWVEPADYIGTGMLALGTVAMLIGPRLLIQRWKRGE